MHGWLNALNNSNVSKRKLQEMDHSNANDHGHPVGIHSTISIAIVCLQDGHDH